MSNSALEEWEHGDFNVVSFGTEKFELENKIRKFQCHPPVDLGAIDVLLCQVLPGSVVTSKNRLNIELDCDD